ncbi:hypothetical protein CRI94_15410 [Longibacter salinarum]|uniref:Uncharacterized protein n=1 Tax=Longibacter salinarum TaxID=1850348 RepID=A0A2A8CV52_9BACT|nr:hypothetical protein [Longibacter salinarum]PEN11421.1 hypothetical protein CRI94_15410 [Longibacter salinarum]
MPFPNWLPPSLWLRAHRLRQTYNLSGDSTIEDVVRAIGRMSTRDMKSCLKIFTSLPYKQRQRILSDGHRHVVGRAVATRLARLYHGRTCTEEQAAAFLAMLTEGMSLPGTDLDLPQELRDAVPAVLVYKGRTPYIALLDGEGSVLDVLPFTLKGLPEKHHRRLERRLPINLASMGL